MRKVVQTSILIALAFGVARADTLTLRDGKRITGKIVSETDAGFVVEERGAKVEVPRDKVLAIVREDAPAAAAEKPREAEKPATEDGLPEATKLEKEGLALEAVGKFREGMEKFEGALRAAAEGSGEEAGARVEFLVRRCAFFWNKLAEHKRGFELLSQVNNKSAKLPPYTRDVVRWFATGQLRAIGEDAGTLLDQLGYGTTWYVIGSFDNERGNGFGQEYGPETEAFDPKATFKGKKRDVFWRLVPIAKPIWGDIDLDAMLRPNDQSLAYALTYIHADEPTKVALRLASDEAVKVWVNRQLVSSEEKRRPLRFDQTHLGVELHKGWNEVLLKVCDQTGPWGFRVRLTAPEGGPAKGARWASVDELAKTQTFEKGTKTFEPSRGAVAFYEARRKADPRDARSRFRLGYLYYSDRPHDDNEHLDREALDEACKLEPNDATYQVFYSHTAAAHAEFSVNKEENKRRQALERALELDPKHAQAAWLLAGYYESSLHNATRTRELLVQALEANPDFLDARLQLLGIDERAGLHPLVARTMRDLGSKPEAATYVPLMRRLMAQDQQRGDLPAHAAWLEKLAALDRTDAGPLHELANIAQAQGRVDKAIKLLAQASALSPWDLRVRERLAHVHEVAGDLASAEQTLRAALEVAPEDDGLLQRLGHVLERENNDGEARKTFERALEVNPNLVDLRKYLEYLDRKKSGGAPWEDEWKLDPAPAIEAAKKVPVDPSLSVRVLLRNVVTKVNPDGTSSTFTQELERIENDEGKKNNHRIVWFHQGEQKAAFKLARVHRKAGGEEDAPVSESTGGARGEFASYGRLGVELPDTLEIGDVVETWTRVDDLVQSFFGDYFGTDQRFGDYSSPIDHLRFVVITPKEKKLFVHKTGLDDLADDVKEKDGKTVRTWEKRGIARIEPEPSMPWAQEVLPKVQVSTFADWNTFAKWYWGLVKKQQEADDAIKTKVKELTADCKTDDDKIRKVYNFVVTEIRYNSAWEFGVHGFKPYNATSIFARKFGDCKDKATLINTMLAECKIESYPVLIFGENPRGKEDLELPLMHHFNHCISYVPSAKGGKGMWLDGTAQYHPFDTLPTMDYGATTLIVRPDRGELKTIPFRGPEANFEKERHEIKVKPDGGADIHSTFEGSGDFNWWFRRELATKGRRSEIFEKAVGRHYSGAKVKNVKCSELENLDEPVKVEVEVGVPKLFQKSTGGFAIDEVRSWLFDGIYLHGQKISNMATKEARDFDVVLQLPSGVEEETSYELPAGMDVKSVPKETKLETPFGTYLRSYKLEKGKLKVTRKLELKTNRIPKASYEEFRKFVGDIERSENERVILSKESGEE